jgi:uncharacterized protein YndB with AHSA1/START domain
MTTATMQESTTLTVTEVFSAPVDRVFAAWTRPELIQRWFGPGTMTVPELSADVRPGGRYRIVMQDTDGARHVVLGEYREIVPETHLSFSWRWESSQVVTEVDLRFRALDGSRTELTLTHDQFPDADARDRHGKGWAGCLLNLRRFLTA